MDLGVIIGVEESDNLAVGAGSFLIKYYAFGGKTIAMDKDGILNYLFSDHLGSSSMAVSPDGLTIQVSRTLPYGQARTDLNGTAFPSDKTFNGQRNEDFGLLDFNARFYSPVLGRFASPDTIVPEPGNALDWDRFMFVRGNPLRFSDPSGHRTTDECGPDGLICSRVGDIRKYVDYDFNSDLNISKEEAEIYFLKHLVHPNENLVVTTKFGDDCTTNGCVGKHPGIDFADPVNPYAHPGVVSDYDGTIVILDDDPTGDFGRKVVIEHKILGYTFYSVYAHLESINPNLELGANMDANSFVGEIGNTPWETGDIHLHYEVSGVLDK